MADEEKKEGQTPPEQTGGSKPAGSTDSGVDNNQEDDAASWARFEETIERITGKVVDERLGKWQPPQAAQSPHGQSGGQGGQEGQTQSPPKTRSTPTRKPHFLERAMGWPGRPAT